MSIDTPLQAEHQLDQLAGQFDHWRQTRTHPYERIPRALWEQAVAVAAVLPPSRVAKHLRLRLGDLQHQIARQQAEPVVLSPAPLGFVEVPPPPLPLPALPAIQLELSRADGTRLCLHAPAATLPLDAVVRAFLEGR